MFAKFPPQHRNRCYCQSRRQCLVDQQTTSDKRINQPIFVKAQNRIMSPAQLSSGGDYDSPASNMFRSSFNRTINQHCSALATELNAEFIPSTGDNEHPYYTNQRLNYDRHLSALHLPPSINHHHHNHHRVISPRSELNTVDEPEICRIQPNHQCQVRYQLNERNQPVPVCEQNKVDSVSCCICEKSFSPDVLFRPSIKPNQVIYCQSSCCNSNYSTPSSDDSTPSMILEIKSPHSLVFRSSSAGSLVNIQLRRNEIPVKSLALKYQRRY